ncbi:hypothetical protein [Thermosipho sp. 1074]|uniref:hypothetical protein n=1 Tax=Thermosipho sp. 1074 TaxID=1643331 RepID=UPI001E34BB76|nr:hypothetical protein [Thermosipho sp. 1074]
MFSQYTYQLIHGKGSLFKRIKLFEELGIKSNEIAEILFWANPYKFPFPMLNEEYTKDFVEKRKKILSKLKLKDFLELYAYETVKEQTFLKDIVFEINEITFFDLKKINWIKDLVRELDPISKEKIKELSKIHPYLLRALFVKPECPVILDGNNIAHWTFPANINNIIDVFDKLSTTKKFYFPFYIVFDRNAKYMFKNNEILKFQNVYFYSPADEMILTLAKKLKAKIISKDKFRDWDKNIKKHILKI